MRAGYVHKGTLFGLLIVASTINLTLGLTVLLLISLFLHYSKPTRSDGELLLFLLLIKILWIISIDIMFSESPLYYILYVIAPDIILLVALFSRFSFSYVRHVLRLLYLLFLVDISFNIFTLLTGADPLGRVPGSRPDDIIMRMGGVFGHPFYSVNITLIGMICAIVLQKKTLIILSAVGFLINGTFRSPLMLSLILMIYILHRYHFGPVVKYGAYFLFISSVFATTFISTLSSDFESGNVFRVIAWVNAVTHIMENPVIGTHTFLSGPFDHMSAETIISYGIAESPILQLGLDYGLVPMILTIVVLAIIVNKNSCYYERSSHGDKGGDLGASIMASVVFIDAFYGSAYGSMLVTFVFGILCVSLNNTYKK